MVEEQTWPLQGWRVVVEGTEDTLEELTEEFVFEKGCENTLDWGEN